MTTGTRWNPSKGEIDEAQNLRWDRGGSRARAVQSRGRHSPLQFKFMLICQWIRQRKKRCCAALRRTSNQPRRRFAGYIDVKLDKLRSAFTGKAPPGLNYRFVLTYESEELRQKWIASEVHQTVWGAIEILVRTKDYAVLLFDVRRLEGRDT